MSDHETEDPWAFKLHSNNPGKSPLKRILAHTRREIDTLRQVSARDWVVRSIRGTSRTLLEMADPLDMGFKPVAIGAVAGFFMTGHLNAHELLKHTAHIVATLAHADARIIRISADLAFDHAFDRIGHRLETVADAIVKAGAKPVTMLRRRR